MTNTPGVHVFAALRHVSVAISHTNLQLSYLTSLLISLSKQSSLYEQRIDFDRTESCYIRFG